jgi:hypothetical protein
MRGGNCCVLGPNVGSRPQQRLQLKKKEKKKLVSDDGILWAIKIIGVKFSV